MKLIRKILDHATVTPSQSQQMTITTPEAALARSITTCHIKENKRQVLSTQQHQLLFSPFTISLRPSPRCPWPPQKLVKLMQFVVVEEQKRKRAEKFKGGFDGEFRFSGPSSELNCQAIKMSTSDSEDGLYAVDVVGFVGQYMARTRNHITLTTISGCSYGRSDNRCCMTLEKSLEWFCRPHHQVKHVSTKSSGVPRHEQDRSGDERQDPDLLCAGSKPQAAALTVRKGKAGANTPTKIACLTGSVTSCARDVLLRLISHQLGW